MKYNGIFDGCIPKFHTDDYTAFKWTAFYVYAAQDMHFKDADSGDTQRRS